jgi:23S rRNA G2069 N7-methylase RlmK/C1962 C5-methylase RlmI
MRITVKARASKRLEAGHPWVFRSDILAADPAVRDGDVVDAADERGRFLGRGFFNGRSQIAFRLLTRREEDVTPEFFTSRLETAWAYRVRLCDAGCCRVVHSESDFLPGLIVDKYDATLVLQTLSLGLERFKAPIANPGRSRAAGPRSAGAGRLLSRRCLRAARRRLRRGGGRRRRHLGAGRGAGPGERRTERIVRVSRF